VFISTVYQALYSKNLLKLGITHVLNLSATEFTKRSHYFEYLNLDIFDTHDEDIKKHFRISNRFIADVKFYKEKLIYFNRLYKMEEKC